MKCNRDCFNCIYEDCIDDSKGAGDKRPYIKRGIVASSKSEYEKIYHDLFYRNKKKALQKRYAETHKEEISAWHKAYYRRKKGEQCSAESVSMR